MRPSIAEAPVQLVNSGPSMAPVAALAYGSPAGTDTLIVGDTGGTTFDVSLVRDGRIPRTRETWLGQPLVSHMTGMPSVDVRSIGAGGGSIAWVDQRRASPCRPDQRRRGARAGRLSARRHAADRHRRCARPRLHRRRISSSAARWRSIAAAAEAALKRDVADPLGKSLEEAATAVIELATENMVQAIMDITVNQGIDPTDGGLSSRRRRRRPELRRDRAPARLPPRAGPRDRAPLLPPPAR